MTTIQASTSTAYRKGMESITGQMAAFTRAISVMEPGMDMAFGKATMRLTSALIEWTVRRASACILGRTRKCIRASLETTTETAMERCTR
jgi:hypothetical protein